MLYIYTWITNINKPMSTNQQKGKQSARPQWGKYFCNLVGSWFFLLICRCCICAHACSIEKKAWKIFWKKGDFRCSSADVVYLHMYALFQNWWRKPTDRKQKNFFVCVYVSVFVCVWVCKCVCVCVFVWIVCVFAVLVRVSCLASHSILQKERESGEYHTFNESYMCHKSNETELLHKVPTVSAWAERSSLQMGVCEGGDGE